MNRWDKAAQHLLDIVRMMSEHPKQAAPFSRDQWQTLPGLLEALFHLESQSRPAVRALVHHIVKAHTVPAMSPTEEYFLWSRILNACDFLGHLQIEDTQGRQLVSEPCTDYSDADVLLWLLDSLWETRFDSWLKLEAVHLVTGRPLYGLDPASLS